MGKKHKKEELSAIDEVIELKFGKDANVDMQKREEIIAFLEQLHMELDELEDDDDDEKESQRPHFDKEMVTAINDDDTPEGMIPFVVIRKEKTTVDLKCPHCGGEDKMFLNNFRKTQYNDYECPNCKKKSLVKLDFNPFLKIYIEKQEG